MTILQTPEDRFEQLLNYDFKPNYVQLGELRMHFVDEGNPTAEPILLLHGEPTWSYLYRKMIPILVADGHRVIAPDLIGFGKSDKILEKAEFSYKNHVLWLTNFIQLLDLQNITLVCQDWGGLLGLRLAAENESRFKRICAANTFLPTGENKASEAFLAWQQFSQTVPNFPTGNIVSGGCVNKLSPEEIAAYDAPFPDENYKTAARMFPLLVPTSPDDPASAANKKAWEVLRNWQKPFLTAFSDSDPITNGLEKFFHKNIPGCEGQKHTTIQQAGHFLQEDKGEIWAEIIVDFIREN